MSSIGLTAWKMTYELSPIILSGGLAQNIPGNMLPIISITESINFVRGLLSGADNLDVNNFFAFYRPLPGAKLISNDYGKYPFANQAVAANAIIANPLPISLRMTCPVKGDGGYAAKIATMMALQAALASHGNSGGTYIVATPAYIYTNCLLIDLTDVSAQVSKQPQTEWQWDFHKPLLTLADAEQAQNSLLSKISGGQALPGDPPSATGLASAVGSNAGNATPAIAPAASGTGGAGATPPQGP